MAKHRKDDLNLSLTGSQISALSVRSSSSQLNSAHSRRANSLLDVRPNKTGQPSPQTDHSSNRGGYQPVRRGSLKDEPTAPSGVSTPHSVQKHVNGRESSGQNQEEDFLALFESSYQPKIKAFSQSHAGSAKKKQSPPGAFKKTQSKSKKPAWASRPTSDNNSARSQDNSARSQDNSARSQDNSARSQEPQNIFHASSAHNHFGSDEDDDDDMQSNVEMIEELGNSLSQSIRKLESQLSNVTKPVVNSMPSNNLTLDSYRSGSTTSTPAAGRPEESSGEFTLQGLMDQTPRSTEQAGSGSSTKTLTSLTGNNKLWDSKKEGYPRSHLANNISHPGQMQKVKASLSSMENSYQNFKRKTPVNQVRSSTSANVAAPMPSVPHSVSASSLARSDQQNNTESHGIKSAVSLKLAVSGPQDYSNLLHSSATKIQKWYFRHKTRRAAAEAAMKRLLDQKRKEHELRRQQELVHTLTAADEQSKKAERKKLKEHKERELRQQAIKDLKQKREERKKDLKKLADEEIKYLQANGKISKRAAHHTSLGPKKIVSRDSNNEELEQTSVQELATQAADTSWLVNNVDKEEPPKSSKESVRETEAGTRTTLEDLFTTLKKLEEEENFLSLQTEKKSNWLDDLEKSQEEELNSNLTAENLEKLNAPKDELSKSGFLTDDKLKSIINFLDEVQVNDRLSGIEMEISQLNAGLDKPALLVPSAQEVAQLEQAQATASQVTSTVLTQRLELEEKRRTVSMLQTALNQQRELTVRHARETEKEMKKRLDVQKEEYEEAIKRHLSFIDQLIDDKKSLGEKCEKFVLELKTIDKKYQDKIKSLEESHVLEMTKLKEVQAAAEKLRREKWIEDKTRKIKEMTVKGLEPEIQRLIAKHKSDINKMKNIHEAELLQADERVAQKYVKMTEELRDQLAAEKEAACARERELSKQRFEKQLQQEEEAYQQQRRRLYQEVQEEKDRVATSVSRQRAELERLQRQLEDNHRIALESMREEFEKSREEQERRHTMELKNLQEKLKLEKESWEENYMKRHDTWLVQKERELREQIKKERDKDIELVIERLEEDASTIREENEKSTEQKIRRLREKFETETRELEQSERKAVKKYNEMKAKLAEVEGENERAKVIIRQKEQEILDIKKLLEKMNSERSHVSDIIRQEFADRIVTTDDENKRIKQEMSELRARHRLELEKSHTAMEELKKASEEEIEKVHQRVKQAIVRKEEVVAQLKQQYLAANKRADHLEGLLEQQRKQLLGRK